MIAEQLERQRVLDPYLRAWIYVTESDQVPELVECVPSRRMMSGACDGVPPVPTGRMVTQTVDSLLLFDAWGVDDFRAMRTLAVRVAPLVPSR